MTPIEQTKEALQEVSDTMDRKGGVAPIIRMDTLKKVNAALALLKTMEGEPVAISIRQDVQTIDMLCRIHKVIQEFREPTRKTVFYCPVGGQAERLAELHDELDLWLKTETIRATDPPQSDTLTTLTLSMTEEEIDRIGREQYPPDTTNDGEPWYNHEQATRNMYFKDGLRYASTHTKTITVERTFTLSEVTAYADDLMTAHLDPGRVVDREKDEQGADWIHRARNHVNAKHGVSPDSA